VVTSRLRYAWTSSLGGFLFLNTLYLQDVRGFNPLVAGFCLLPMAVMLAVCAPLSGRIVASSGARIPLVAAAHRGPARPVSGKSLARMRNVNT
jgi:hypothetical protein